MSGGRENVVYYLRCIHRRLQTIQEAMPDDKGLALGNLALADEADWLDAYIDSLARQSTPAPDCDGDLS